MQTPTGRPDRTLIVILSIIAAVVVLAVVVVFTRGAPAPLDASSPEGVVQAYSQAIMAGDRDAALELVPDSVRKDCEPADYGTNSQLRMSLRSTEVTGDRAVIRVGLSQGYSTGPFGGGAYESEDTFTLERIDGQWLVTNAPWSLIVCYNMGANS